MSEDNVELVIDNIKQLSPPQEHLFQFSYLKHSCHVCFLRQDDVNISIQCLENCDLSTLNGYHLHSRY